MQAKQLATTENKDAPPDYLLASWLVIDEKDLPLNPRLVGKPGVGQTTLAYAAAKSFKNFWTNMDGTYRSISVLLYNHLLIMRAHW